jgi:glycosyltransferase involved in cell wall biosynthesis
MICVLIAAYNEGESFRTLLPAIPATVSGEPVVVVVASDGSTDDTVAVAEERGCVTIDATVNRGKGFNLRRGIARADELPYDVLVLLDGDGQHDPGDLERMVAPILDGTADHVAGSRYADSSGRGTAPWNRYLVRCATTTLLTRLLGQRFTDPYCGYRALTPRAVQQIELTGDRYQSELEILFESVEHGLNVVEIPIHKVYGPNTSKMSARRGPLLGRLEVIAQYLSTIVREMSKRRRGRRPRPDAMVAR